MSQSFDHDEQQSLSGSAQPRAIIHKKILNQASSNPDTDMASLADMVSGASTDLVEKVLREYGDPGQTPADQISESHQDQFQTGGVGEGEAGGDSQADEPDKEDDLQFLTESEDRTVSPGASKESGQTDAGTNGEDASSMLGGEANSDEESSSDRVTLPDPAEISAIQRETLRMITKHPEATQRELADLLDISGATVNQRVNSIEGFSWDDRDTFAELMVDRLPPEETKPAETAVDLDHLTEAVSELRRTVDELSASLSERQHANDSPIDDPLLISKVVHACMDSEQISREEEVIVLRGYICSE